MSERILGALVVVALLLIGGLALDSWWRPSDTPAALASAPATPVPAPAVRWPVPPTAEALPALTDSDSHAAAVLARLLGNERFRALFVPDHLVRRFVTTVDSLPRESVAPQVVPLQPVEGGFVAATDPQGRMTIDPKNHARYRRCVLLAEAVEAETLHAAYVSLYPLMQASYEELGYPGRYFNDRVVEAIDDLLAAPEVRDPVLVQPETLHRFADPDLEGRSAGQKILIRMGPENAARVKARLRALRTELVAGSPASASR